MCVECRALWMRGVDLQKECVWSRSHVYGTPVARLNSIHYCTEVAHAKAVTVPCHTSIRCLLSGAIEARRHWSLRSVASTAEFHCHVELGVRQRIARTQVRRLLHEPDVEGGRVRRRGGFYP